MKSLSLAAILSMAMMDPHGPDFGIPSGRRFKEKTVKNKYGLTPPEIEAMESMTPKEKKSFLKGRK